MKNLIATVLLFFAFGYASAQTDSTRTQKAKTTKSTTTQKHTQTQRSTKVIRDTPTTNRRRRSQTDRDMPRDTVMVPPTQPGKTN